MRTVGEVLAVALEHHRAGRLADAGALYSSLLAQEPEQPDALHLLGVATAQAGRAAEAEPLIARAIALRPGVADFHANHAQVLDTLGRTDEALTAYTQALRLNPNHPDALRNMARLLARLERLSAAADALRACVERTPDDLPTVTELARLCERLGRGSEAETWYRHVLARDPFNILALNNLGELKRRAGDAAEAVSLLSRAVSAAPDAPLPRCALANTLTSLFRFEEAEAHLAEAARRRPDALLPHRDLGVLLRLLGRSEEALAAFQVAATLAPQDPVANFGVALCLLRLGRYREGFAHYRWRWPSAAKPPRHQGLPAWSTGVSMGTPAGLRLLVWHEQGVGDTLMCLRFLPQLTAAGARLTIEVPAGLAPLVAAQGYGAVVVDAQTPAPGVGSAAPLPWDGQVPMMDLPGRFCPDPAAVPWTGPYLKADPGRKLRWTQMLGPKRGLRVGLFWQGNPDFPDDHWRSPGLAPLLPLLDVPGVEFVSLQMGPAKAALTDPAIPPGRIRDAAASIRDWADTAALVAGLDLVIGSDSACIHLAGALDVPAFLLLSPTTDWRWHDRGDTSPWYPSLRLFRQTRLGDWTAPVAAVKAALEERVAGR
ncbi:tetratricopeptide (TPR) repeat protein [Nitrospirillum amazonense]|uniref:Tetratricopeptide (TPR) repeat protein n=1 Tax=Nitrospirillum amazonense TaxID=28077 RepID=A0A560K8T2_9PROT|nr:tetratricopeptide repeat protein [Nitrospirillum amazonense]TWB79616.1 tetratricopeptide (TPR) repeat protein [Nitrospirillum amazonense]